MTLLYPLAAIVYLTLGLKWAMYNPHPPKPGVAWRICIFNATLVVGLFSIAFYLDHAGHRTAGSGLFAFAAGELTGKGFSFFTSTHPLNPDRRPDGHASAWEEFLNGQGDMLFAAGTAALISYPVKWIFGADILIWVLMLIAIVQLTAKIGAASQHRHELGITRQVARPRFVILALLSTSLYATACLSAYHAPEYFLEIDPYSKSGIMIFFLGMWASLVIEFAVRLIDATHNNAATD